MSLNYVYAIQLPNGTLVETSKGAFFTSRETAREAKRLVQNADAQVVRVPVKTALWERVR